jgi:hypothetical protein
LHLAARRRWSLPFRDIGQALSGQLADCKVTPRVTGVLKNFIRLRHLSLANHEHLCRSVNDAPRHFFILRPILRNLFRMVCEVIPLSEFRGVLDHVVLDGTGFGFTFEWLVGATGPTRRSPRLPPRRFPISSVRHFAVMTRPGQRARTTARAPSRFFPHMVAATCRGLASGKDKTSRRSARVASRISRLKFSAI